MLGLKALRSRLVHLTAMALIATIAPAHAACNIVNGNAYGECRGVRINKGIKGHLTVRSYVSESGIIAGADVLKSGELLLSGVSNGDITVYEGGRLVLTGIVNGTVKNLGGRVDIEGILDHLHTTGGPVVVGGNVGSISGPGPVSYRNGAVVGGSPIDRAANSSNER